MRVGFRLHALERKQVFHLDRRDQIVLHHFIGKAGHGQLDRLPQQRGGKFIILVNAVGQTRLHSFVIHLADTVLCGVGGKRCDGKFFSAAQDRFLDQVS